MIAGLLVAYGAKEGSTTEAVAELLSGIISGSTYKLSTTARSLAKHFMAYLQKELMPAFDALPLDLDLLSSRDKEQILDKLAEQGSAEKYLAYLLATSTTRQVQSALAALVKKIAPEMGHVVVKSPIALAGALKQEMRKHLKTDFIVFLIDTSLLGGLLIYRNGQLIDNSWLGRIKSLNPESLALKS